MIDVLDKLTKELTGIKRLIENTEQDLIFSRNNATMEKYKVKLEAAKAKEIWLKEKIEWVLKLAKTKNDADLGILIVIEDDRFSWFNKNLAKGSFVYTPKYTQCDICSLLNEQLAVVFTKNPVTDEYQFICDSCCMDFI